MRPAKTQISLGGSDQPGHPPSLVRVFDVRMKKPWVLSYHLSAQRRLWSDWAGAQAVLSLRWAHSHFVGFVMLRLIYYSYPVKWEAIWRRGLIVLGSNEPCSCFQHIWTKHSCWTPDKTRLSAELKHILKHGLESSFGVEFWNGVESWVASLEWTQLTLIKENVKQTLTQLPCKVSLTINWQWRVTVSAWRCHILAEWNGRRGQFFL